MFRYHSIGLPPQTEGGFFPRLARLLLANLLGVVLYACAVAAQAAEASVVEPSAPVAESPESAAESAAAPELVLSTALGAAELFPVAQYLLDPDGSLSLSDVQQARGFQPVGSRAGMNFGYTTDVIWLRIPLRSVDAEAARWLVEMEYAYLDDVRLYAVRGTGEIEQSFAGRRLAVSEWPLADRKAVFPLRTEANETLTLYIRGANHAALALDVRMATVPQFSLDGKKTLIILSLYFGTLFSLGLYNLLLWLPIRQGSFLLYSLFEFSFGFAALSMNGVGPLLLWPQSAADTSFIVPTFYTLAAMFAVLFARSFLDLRTVAPGWHRFLTFIALCWSGATLLTLAVPETTALKVMSVTGMLTTLSLLATGIAAMRLRVHASGIFVAAWSVLLIGTTLLSLRNAGFIPSNFITVYSMQIGSALEMLLLSFALGARFNLLRKQKESVQQQLVDTLREHERILESRVARRTEELLEAKARLEAQLTEDALTGVLNRLGLRQHFLHASQRAQRAAQPLTVMLIDLDGFKPVNDTYGHEAGDILLRAIAIRLKDEVRVTDAVGRLGGDEFVLILEGVHQHEIQLFSERLLAAICRPVDIGWRSVNVSASIGVYQAPVNDETLKSMLRAADDAMYEVKRNGKNGVAIAETVTV
ncbi:diguanylate cyclase domain-containing protein [Thalassolituus sp. LLYu03]|uniref:diguanylate cyclase domain-containing protein n=1 Tax=Thalassolituus sp. LLYu03 TaxID=3421656 RepID=UPI003D2A35FD